ncbi:MAG: LacI family DNA-binding transcriptional regulator [Bacilli bacterium]|nr:LacI family DNA-binding transcriptional regulator [Bacilli bacterium]
MRSTTIKDVAKRSGVGIGTVSRVLNNDPKVSEKTRKKVKSAIEELNYVPNVIGKKLSQNRSNVIAVVVPVIDHPFFASLIAKLELEADKHHYSLLVATSQHRIEKEREILNRIAQNEADGAIFVTHYEHEEKEFENLAIVSIDRHLGSSIPIVTSNNYEATKQGIEYLLDKGAKKIAYLGSKPSSVSEVSFREKAYLDMMKENNLEPLVINEIVDHGEEKVLIDKLLRHYPNFDSVFVSNCTLAHILLNELRNKNIKVPEDVQVLSYDGEFANNGYSKTTTLQQPIDLMASKCVESLIKLINNENNVDKLSVFDCQFVKGTTTY